jgi:hypothetical protein
MTNKNLYIKLTPRIVTAVMFNEEMAGMYKHIKNAAGIKEWIEDNGDVFEDVIRFSGTIIKIAHDRGEWMDYILQKNDWIVKMEDGKYITYKDPIFKNRFLDVTPDGLLYFQANDSELLDEYTIDSVEYDFVFFGQRRYKFIIGTNEVLSGEKMGGDVLGHVYFSKKDYYKSKNKYKMATEIERLIKNRGFRLLMSGTEEELFNIIQIINRK